MNNDESIPSDAETMEATAKIQKAMERLAKRGIVYTGPARCTEDFTAGESGLFGPTTELSYRRLLKELSEDGNDTDD